MNSTATIRNRYAMVFIGNFDASALSAVRACLTGGEGRSYDEGMLRASLRGLFGEGSDFIS